MRLNNMVQTGNVEQLGEKAQKQAIKLKVQGLSVSAITDELNKDFTANLTTDQVENYLRRQSNKTFNILKEDKKFQEKLAKQYFDTISQMNELNNEMREFFMEIRKDPEYSDKYVVCPECNHKFTVQMKTFGTLIKAADHLLNQIKHVDNILGKMQNKSLTVNYNFVDLSKKLINVMPQLLERAERMGIAKINKKNFNRLYNK